MKNLVIKTTEEDFIIANVDKDMPIEIDQNVMFFGNEIAVKLDTFLNYRFVEVKENDIHE
jgi:hypothetical protein